MIKVVSFDMHGTLTSTGFSDEFWRDFLPKAYANHHGLTLPQAKKDLKSFFTEIGKYDKRYYSAEYWLDRLGIAFNEAVGSLKSKPHFFKDVLPLLSLNKRFIVVSSTTRSFIELEMYGFSQHFEALCSSLDDFHIPGKPPVLYPKVAALLGVKPSEILHIGDDYEMDVQNAAAAGLKAFYFNKRRPVAELISEIKK